MGARRWPRAAPSELGALLAITAAVLLADECSIRSFALAGQRSRLLGCLRRWH
jgi:hypothetical protein